MANPLRVLHVTHQYLPAIGGSEKYIADLSESLVERGHQVDVFTARSVDYHTWRNDLPPYDQQNGVNIYRFASLRRGPLTWRALHFGLRNYWRTRARRFEPFIFFGGGPNSPGMAWALWRQARQYDLIHLNCLVYTHVIYGYWIARRLGVPVVITPHAHIEQEQTYNIGFQREALLGADHVIAVTTAERDRLLELGISPWRVSVTGNGLNVPAYRHNLDTVSAREKLNLPQDAFIVLFLGRKVRYKGWDMALDAYAALKPQIPGLHFLAVGPETDDSAQLWPKYRDLSGLHVLGRVSDEEKLAALQACDCLILPSAGEAFGIVFLEAWLMGKPVIGLRTVAVSSLVEHGRDGLLAEPGNLAGVTAALAQLATHPNLARKLGENGRQKVLRRYTTERIAAKTEAIYFQTLRRHRRETGDKR
ncbi:MAG: glycosyltransferase family 1 protein [Chloroflexi bacterium]|nr:MAG: glycosyltransferase family 1 protein [Chloroflexota bacterium]